MDEQKMLKLDAMDRARIEMDAAYRQVRRRTLARVGEHVDAQLAGFTDENATFDPVEGAKKALASLSVQLLEAGHVPVDG